MAGKAESIVMSNHVETLLENTRAVIQNPIGHLTQDEVAADVRTFASHMGLTEIQEGLERGALVAQNPMLYDQVARHRKNGEGLRVQLTESEKVALRNERDTLFSQSAGLYMTVLTVSLAAFLQGHVQSSINGATLYFPDLFGIPVGRSVDSNYSGHNDWLVGVTNAAPFLFAAVLGCPLVDPINHQFGRRGAIFIAAILIFVSSVGSAFTTTWPQLFVCRIFNGIGMGLKASSTPILASETAVSFWRGSAALCWQLWVAFGIMIGFAVNLLFSLEQDTRTAMGLILGAPCVPALVLMASIYWCPESPRWHMLEGTPESYRKAHKIFRTLRNTELQADRDLYIIHKQIEVENLRQFQLQAQRYGSFKAAELHKRTGLAANVSSYFRKFAELFVDRRLRNALLACCTVMLAQQLSGINILAFYSGTVFFRANPDTRIALLYSFGIGAVNFIFGIPAIRTIDTHGRRRLLLTTLPFMSICLLISATCFLPLNAENGPAPGRIGVIAVFLYIFTALYSPGMGPMPFTITSESFPLSHREMGVAFSVSVNLFLAGLLTVFYPRLDSALTSAGALGLFSGLNLIAFVLILLWVPETKQRSLEELDWVFAVPVTKFVHYQVGYYLPWLFKRYVMGWKDLEFKGLYDDNIWGSEGGKEKGRMSQMRSATRQKSVAVAPDEPAVPSSQPDAETDPTSAQPSSNWQDELRTEAPGAQAGRLRDGDRESVLTTGTYD